MSKPWLTWALVAILILIGGYIAYRAVSNRPLPQVQPTLDVQRPTQPVRELAPTPTPTSAP